MPTKKTASQDLTPEKLTKSAKAFYAETGSKIVTASNVKKFFAGMGLRTEAGLEDIIAKNLYREMLAAAKRTIGNKRKTVIAQDF